MRAAGRHTVPPLGPTAASRPGFHLADPATAVHHATSLTLQPRQPPPAMRPASPCSPGNCRPPCDQPTLQTRQPPPAMRPASPCSPGNCRPPCDQPHLADPATAARPSCRPSPYRPNRCRTAQAVLTRSRRLFHGPAAPPQPKGAEGTAERARSWQGSRRGGAQSEEPAAVSGRTAGGRIRSRKAGE